MNRESLCEPIVPEGSLLDADYPENGVLIPRRSTDELTRANLLERWQAYRIAREVGALNANEIRRAERYNPRTDPAGDEYLSPLNMAGEQAGKPQDKE